MKAPQPPAPSRTGGSLLREALSGAAAAALLVSLPWAGRPQDPRRLYQILARGAAGTPPAGVHRVFQRDGEIVIEAGPFRLPPGAHHWPVPVELVEFPVGGWLHGFVVEAVDRRNGKDVLLPAKTLCHTNLIDPDHRELFYPISRRLLAAGAETGKKKMPFFFGVPVKRGDRVLVSTLLHNFSDGPYENAYLRIRLFHSPAESRMPRRAVYPFYLDVMPPVGSKFFDLPTEESVRSWEASPAIPGKILIAGGHLHSLGMDLRLEELPGGSSDGDSGRLLWHAAARKDERGVITGIPLGHFWWRGGLLLTPDRRYRLSARYYNPVHATIPSGGMGAMGGLFAPLEGAQWPEVDRRNPDYLADLKFHLRLSEPSSSASPRPPAVWSCPMHPEVHGKAGEKCPRCGMALAPSGSSGGHSH